MCGIFGFIANIPEMDYPLAHTFLANLFMESVARGKDASGFAAMSYDLPDVLTEKRNVNAHAFVNRSSKFRALKKKMPNIFIGHTRAVTTGDPKRNRNNHPFLSQRLALVHNGKVPEWDKTAHLMGLELRTETDSEILLRILDKAEGRVVDGCRNIIDNVDKSSDYAIAFFNHGALQANETRDLYLFRNLGRPLEYIRVDKWEAVFFASTREIIVNAIDKTFGNRAEAAKNLGIDEPKFVESFACHRLTHGSNGKVSIISTKLEPPKSSSSTTQTTPSGSAGGDSSGWDSEGGFHGPFLGPVSDRERSSVPFSHMGVSGGGVLIPADSIMPGNVMIADHHQMGQITKETGKEIKALEKGINESLAVIKSVQQNAYMSDFEYNHFMQWMLDV
jgi:predicted glutamine amidotransferase